MRIYKKYDDKVFIGESFPVCVKECGNITEIQYISKNIYNNEFPIEKINENSYMIKSTGEIKEYKRGDSRLSDTQSVKRSLEELRDYINTNVTDPLKCRWITLTYAENMTEPRRLKNDFKDFNRLCRNKYGNYEYITVAEPQARGAWHLHCIFIFDKKAPYMKNEDVREMWGQGFVNIRKLKDVDNVGMYLTAYLTDMPLDEVIQEVGGLPDLKADDIRHIEIEGKDRKTETKAFVKGARMKMYPCGFHIHRESKGIKKPRKEKIPYKSALERVSGMSKTYEKSVVIEDDENKFSMIINKQYFNKNPNAKVFKEKKHETNSNT